MLHEDVGMERFGKGIGNSARFCIVDALLEKPRSVTELTAIVGLSQSAVSQHLKKLKSCGLVTDTRHGHEILYSFNGKHLLTSLTAFIHRIHKSHAFKNSHAKRT